MDAHWPDAGLVVELDGYSFHAHRRAFEADRERDAVLVAAGWRVVRITDRQLREQPDAVAARLTRLLSGAPVPGRA